MQLCEELQLNLLSYLNANDLITFCYESKYFRKLLLKKFSKIFEISAGFCSVQDWTYVIQKNVFNLIRDIHNDLFFNETFYTYNFDFEENYDKLLKRFCHMSLFSVCLHFLRCRRSCERNANYCKICSRVCDNDYFDVDKFSNAHLISFPSYLDILSDEPVDFDVFCVSVVLLAVVCVILIRQIKNAPILKSLITQGTYLQPSVVFWQECI